MELERLLQELKMDHLEAATGCGLRTGGTAGTGLQELSDRGAQHRMAGASSEGY